MYNSKEVSELLDTTPRSSKNNIKIIYMNIAMSKVKVEAVFNTRCLWIFGLQKAQDKYLKQQTEEYKPIMDYTKKQREEADKKVEIVLLYKKSKLSNLLTSL